MPRDGEVARAEAGVFLNAHARLEFNIPGVTFGGRYDGSSILVPDGTEPPEDRANVYEPSATPGGRPPHLWLEDGRSLFDLFGPEWTLLLLAPAPDDTARFADAAARHGVRLDIAECHSDQARALYQSVLIRPDQIVAWRRCGGYDADAVLAQALGHIVIVDTMGSRAARA